jgi:[protein-PII] uridylyltransferase
MTSGSAGGQAMSLRERRQALLERRELRGRSFCRAYAAEADRWLVGLCERATGDPRRAALLAVGGYGRGELCPHSDLDLVLVHDGRSDLSDLAEAIWYPVWDEGVHLDHSVRRPKDVLSAAAADLRVALGLLDARLVWGDAEVAGPLVAAARAQWRKRLAASWLPALSAQMAERWARHGEVAFLLEPDVKEAQGGLRDAHALRAMATGAPDLARSADLEAVDAATATLLSARVELHRAAGRALDRLVLQEQDQVAAALGYPDANSLMAAVAAAGRTIAWTCTSTWRRRHRWEPPGPGGVGARARLRRRARSVVAGTAGGTARGAPAEPGVLVIDGEVTLAADADARADPALPLRVAAVAAERSAPIAPDALRRLSSAAAPSDPWPEEARLALVRLLAQGHRAVDALEALDHVGVLVRLVPEWELVRNRPQRNAYHRFTVDRHLLETAANAAALTDRVSRPDLLLVGSLLHDIGKGIPGDHTDAGVRLVAQVGRRMGFAEDELATLVTLCRLHLLLPDTATRRDLEDPATIDAAAKLVGDRETLHLLWALTEADGLATGPAAWGPWKAGLVAELVSRVANALAGEPVGAGPVRLGERYGDLVAQVRAEGRPVVQVEPPRLVVAAPDRRGLLASVAGTLALHGLDVRGADVSTDAGVAVEVFVLDVTRARLPDVERLRKDLNAVLAGDLDLPRRLEEKARAYEGTRRPSAPDPVVPSVTVDVGASASSTVVEVRASDEIGLLYRVTRALFDCGLDVVTARVSTVGDEVVDAFYVRDAGGSKVTERALLGRVERAALEALR